MLEDCTYLLFSFKNGFVCYVKRSANQCAHSLARATSSMSNSNVWNGSPPTFLHGDVLF